MMRDLTLAMPLNNALARDVAAILRADETAAQVVMNGAKRAALPVGIIAAIIIALFALSQNAGIWRGRLPLTSSPPTHSVVKNFPDQSVVTERAPAPAPIMEAPTVSAAREDVAVVPESGNGPSNPVLRRETQPSPGRIMVRSKPNGAASKRRAPVMAEAVKPSVAQDRLQVAALAAPNASAEPVASRGPEQSAGYADHAAAVIEETAAANQLTARLDTRRRAALDAIRNLRRQ